MTFKLSSQIIKFFLLTLGLFLVGGILYASTFPTSLNEYSEGDVITSDWANSLETKIGIDNSTIASSIDYLIKNTSSKLGKIASLDVTDGNFIVGNGINWVAESGATARNSIGLGSVENTALSTWIGSGNITTLGTISGELEVSGTSTLAMTTISNLTLTTALADTYISSAATWNAKIANLVEDTTPDLGGNLRTGSYWLSGDGGNEGIFINSVGNVGIGTTGPKGELDIETTGANNPSIALSQNSAGIDGDIIFYESGTLNSILRFHNGGGLEFSDRQPASVSRLYINTDGNVGIGTTEPESKLSIAGSIENIETPRYYRNVATYNYGGGITGTLKITMPKTWSNTMMQVRIQGYNYSGGRGPWEVIVGGYNYAATPAWYNYATTIKGSPPFTQVRLAHDGTYNVILLGNTSTSWSCPKVTVSEFIAGHLNITGWGTGWSTSVITDETGIAYAVTPTIKMYVNNNGNVGIGTVTPDYKLDVNGDLRIVGTSTLAMTTISNGDITGTLTGNADTATALAANPIDCGAGTKAISIDASGNLTCSAVDISADTNLTAGRSLTMSGDSVEADAETYVYKAKIAFEDPVATDDFFFEELAKNVTITSIYCKTLVGTVDLDVTIAGVDINGTDITCTTVGVLDESLAGDTTGLTGEEIALAITSVASSPTFLMVQINGTYDD